MCVLDRYRLLPSGNLQILNVRHSDAGSYRCIAHNPFLQEKVHASYVINLKVVKPRHHTGQPLRHLHFVIKPQENVNSVIGSNVTLECVVNGHPYPKINWIKLDGQLPAMRSFVDGGNLYITALEKGDEGVYICTGTNGKTSVKVISNQCWVIFLICFFVLG